MKFIPEIVSRKKGDYVNPQEYNDNNRKLYVDLRELFERELATAAKGKVLSAMAATIDAGYQREARDEELPTINHKTNFIYPDAGSRAEISTLYGEITAATADSRNILVNDVGKLRDGIIIQRSSDNFIFTENPRSVAETRVEDAVESSDFPYVVRVKGSEEFISMRLNIETSFGFMEMNTVEYVPFPMVGGSEIRDLDMVDSQGQLFPLDDPAGELVDFNRDPRMYYFPIRFVTQTRNLSRISLDVRSSLNVPAQGSIITGVNQIKVLRNLYEPISYIGFRIPSLGGQLKTVKPVAKWFNTYLGEMQITVYDTLAKFRSKSEDFLTRFDQTGTGLPVDLDREVFVLVEMRLEGNTSPQLAGFEYEVE